MIASVFELEPIILQRVRDLAIAGLGVHDETKVAGNVNIPALCPCAVLMTGEGQYSELSDGGLQTEYQYWTLSVMVRHVNDGDSVTTASEAGAYLKTILDDLIGAALHADFEPLAVSVRPSPIYEPGYAVFPVELYTSFAVGE